MSISGIFRSKFIKHNIQLPTSDLLKIKARRELLNPYGKEIAGILHLNGMKVYIPRGSSITIGRSRECDVRIMDPAIEPSHFMLLSKEKGFQIAEGPASRKTKIAIGNIKTKEPKFLHATSLEERYLEETTFITVQLSSTRKSKGQMRPFIMKLELPKRDIEELIFALAELFNKPPVKPT